MADPQKIEKLAGNFLARALMRYLTDRDGRSRCLLADIFAKYGSEDLKPSEKFKYFIPFQIIEYIGRKAGASRESVRDKILHHTSRARALINTVRGVGKYGLIQPQVFSAPLMVVWNFTQACNFQCKHCYQDAHRRLEDELDIDEQLRFIDVLAKNDVPLLAFSGGEPLMGKNFWPVLKEAGRRGFHISVATNGSLLTKEVVARLAENHVNYVEVSIDSVNAKKHDTFRGAPGYWKKAVTGLKNVVADGRMGTGLAATITKLNIDELDDLIRFAKDLGVGTFYAFNFVPTGRAREIIDIDLAPEEREEMLRVLQKTLNAREISVVSSAPQLGRICTMYADDVGLVNTGHYGAGPGTTTKTLARYIGGCGAGRCYCALQPNGDITPCVFMPIVVGNIRRDDFMDVWENNEIFKELRDRSRYKENCVSCNYKYYCGGCRARAYGYFGDVLEADPGCIGNFEKWERLKSELSAGSTSSSRQGAGLSGPARGLKAARTSRAFR